MCLASILILNRPRCWLSEDNGDLKEEMILVCNALRNDLMHANEHLGSNMFVPCATR